MSSTYTPAADTYHTDITVPADGDPPEAATFTPGYEALGDNARYTKDRWDTLAAAFFTNVGAAPTLTGVETLTHGSLSSTVKLVITGLLEGDIVLIQGNLNVNDLNDVEHLLSLWENNDGRAINGWLAVVRDDTAGNDRKTVPISVMSEVQASEVGTWDIRIAHSDLTSSSQDLNLTQPWNLSALVIRP